MPTSSANAALQNVRYPQIISNLTEISFATVLHHAGPANDFQVGDLRQLGQYVVLQTIGKGRVLFLLAQVFKRENGDSSWYWLPNQLTFPHNPACRCRQSNQ